MRPTVIAVDFDETIALRDEEFNPTSLLSGAKETINWLHDDLGCTTIIWTCRNDNILDKAKKFLDENEVKYDKINENADTTNFQTSDKIFADIYIDDRAIGMTSPINWIEVKRLIKKALIKRHAEEVLKVIKGSRGMSEGVQNMYDGVFQDHERQHFDQKEILQNDHTWIDDKFLLSEVYYDERQAAYKDKGTSYPGGHEDYWESYYANPKQTGESISPAITAPDKEVIDQVLEENFYTKVDSDRIKKKPYKRDETQKYKTVDEPLNNEMYWNKDNTYK